MNCTALAISGQLAGGLVRCSHVLNMAMRHFWGSSWQRWAIVFSSPSGISRNVPIGNHSLATVKYSSSINCRLVGFCKPAEQTLYVLCSDIMSCLDSIFMCTWSVTYNVYDVHHIWCACKICVSVQFYRERCSILTDHLSPAKPLWLPSSWFKCCVRKTFTFVLLHTYKPWLSPVNCQCGCGCCFYELTWYSCLRGRCWTPCCCWTVAGCYTEITFKVNSNLAGRLNARSWGLMHRLWQ